MSTTNEQGLRRSIRIQRQTLSSKPPLPLSPLLSSSQPSKTSPRPSQKRQPRQTLSSKPPLPLSPLLPSSQPSKTSPRPSQKRQSQQALSSKPPSSQPSKTSSGLVKQERRAKSLEIIPNKNQHIFEKQYRSLSFSPIYKRLSNLSLKKSFNGIRTPDEFLEYRLKTHEYLSKDDIITQLKIERLLAEIEPNATGIVCLSKDMKLLIDEKPHNIKVAIKIAENKMDDSLKEIFILEEMTKILQEKKYHNLPIIYNSFQKKKRDFILNNLIDDKDKKDKNSLFNKISNFLKQNKNKNYNIYINELANGDLKSFFNKYDDNRQEITEELLNNAIIQIIMSIATLHDIGIRHNDTHYGNFLYHKIKPGGYIKYTIRNKSYYLKNLGYLWVIWDFGISTQLNGITDYFRDYEMLSLYLRKPVFDKEKAQLYNMRFLAKDIENRKNIETRRAQGNLNLKKEIPVLISDLANTIYEFSKNEELEHVVNKTSMEQIIFNKKDNLNEYTKISKTWYNVQVDGKYIDEATFLNEHINKIFTHVFERDVSNINDKDVLFHVNIELKQITLKTGENKKTDYDKTASDYALQKIIIPLKYM